jgi:hypothetical protein
MAILYLPTLAILWAKEIGNSFKEMFSKVVKRVVG